MINFRLHDAFIEALDAAIEEATAHLIVARNAEFGEYRYRVGYISGLADAKTVAEETRKKLLKE